MEMLIGRHSEQKILDTLIRSTEAEFLALYGRRRVGKTFLVRQFCQGKGLFFQVTGQKGGRLSDQLSDFYSTLLNVFTPEFPSKEFANWREAFSLLTLLIKKIKRQQKIILFFDELPWLASKRSGVLQALDYYWNTEWSTLPNVMVHCVRIRCFVDVR